ncbi:MAG: hypothetical protein HYZ47_02370 [Simkania negevensis]|nr:hypothetical protein [Simkania negevensis]
MMTNIRLLHEKGHEEPWIVAMDGKPTIGRVLDYGILLEVGNRSFFSDSKTMRIWHD